MPAMAVTRRSPRKCGRPLVMPSLNGNAVGGCAVRIGRSQSLRKHLRRHFCDLKYTSPRTTLPVCSIPLVERTTDLIRKPCKLSLPPAPGATAASRLSTKSNVSPGTRHSVVAGPNAGRQKEKGQMATSQSDTALAVQDLESFGTGFTKPRRICAELEERAQPVPRMIRSPNDLAASILADTRRM